MGLQLSWLEQRVDNAWVNGSSPFSPTISINAGDSIQHNNQNRFGGGSKKKDKHMIAVAMITAYYAVAGLLGLAYADYKKPVFQRTAEISQK